MRRMVLLLGLPMVACSSPVCPCDELVPLEVSGTVTISGQPSPGRVELWDSQWSDTFADDARLDWTNSSPAGEYRLSTQVARGGCGQFSEYYLRAEIAGLIHRETGESWTWGTMADVLCGSDQIIDIDIEIPEWLTWRDAP